MRRDKFVFRPLGEAGAVPFDSAEEAWLWYCQCQIARCEGVRFTAGRGAVARPCDPDDVYRAVDRLYRRRILGKIHLDVLGRFGLRLAPPGAGSGDSRADCLVWAQALDRLAVPLRAKGIVA
jgi:hypothetical protein